MSNIFNGNGASFPEHAGSEAVLLPDTFPAKAYLMIEKCDREASHVACWNDDGDAFILKDTVEFAATHLPQYFKHSNLQSFIRQLNLYGFRNIRSSKDGAKRNNKQSEMCFRHQNFLRGRRDLLDSIHRAKKGNRSAGKSKARSTDAMETKEEEPSLLNLSLQIDEMSSKLDLLLSLMTDQNPHSATVLPPKELPPYLQVYQNGKRRRYEIGEYRVGSPASVSDGSLDSQTYNNAAAVQDPYSIGNDSRMDVVEEYKEYEPIEYDEKPKASVGELDPLESDEFTEFIDTMLDNDDNDALGGASERNPTPQNAPDAGAQTTTGSKELSPEVERIDDAIMSSVSNQSAAAAHQDPEYSLSNAPPMLTEATDDEECDRVSETAGSLGGLGDGDGSAIVSDAMASKIHPAAVGGVHQQFANNDATIDAVVTTAERVENPDADEENGIQSSPALAEAVEVTEDSTMRGFLARHCRGYRLYIVIALILVLLANVVVWPVLGYVHKRNNAQKSKRPPPRGDDRRPPSGDNGVNNVFDEAKENVKEKWEEKKDRTGTFGDDDPDTDSNLPMAQKSFLRNQYRPRENGAKEETPSQSPALDASEIMDLALNGMRFQCQQLDFDTGGV